MNTAQIDRNRRRFQAVGWVFSAIVLGTGLWVTIATGEWIAILLATALVIIPAGTVKSRARNARIEESQAGPVTGPIPTLR
jgi:hypothetical protein